jgi:hypothetical protein
VLVSDRRPCQASRREEMFISLKWILHDWDDTAAIGILRSCHRAMKPSNRLLLVEHAIGLPNVSSDDGHLTKSGKRMPRLPLRGAIQSKP